jgi:PLP dependent protein
MPSETLQMRLLSIRERMATAAQRVGRTPHEILLVAVSKGQTMTAIASLAATGHRAFGENYIQEWRDKADALADPQVVWHMLGHLQRNKVRVVADRMAWLHTLDSARLAAALSDRITTPLNALIQVNIGEETQKHGVAPTDVGALLEACAAYTRVCVRGLMAIPPLGETAEASRPYFRALASLRDRLNAQRCYPTELDHLSMGMSHDFEVAIEEGATMVRVGTALFGSRS